MTSIPRKLLLLVMDHFKGDLNKAKLWFNIPNSYLKGMKPRNYCTSNHVDRLEKMILDALEAENE